MRTARAQRVGGFFGNRERRRAQRWARRGGFTLIEMLVVVGLMGVVALITGDAIMMAFKVQREERLHDGAVYKIDDAIDRMRRDVWGAREIQAGDDRMDLETAEGAVAWRMMGDGSITRTVSAAGGGANGGAGGMGDDGKRVWTEVPVFHFAVVGEGRAAGLMRVTVDSKEWSGRSDEVMLKSEVMAGGGR